MLLVACLIHYARNRTLIIHELKSNYLNQNLFKKVALTNVSQNQTNKLRAVVCRGFIKFDE